MHPSHMDALRQVIGVAYELDCSLVRIMADRKERNSPGPTSGTSKRGGWGRGLASLVTAVEPVRTEGVTLAV